MQKGNKVTRREPKHDGVADWTVVVKIDRESGKERRVQVIQSKYLVTTP
jgi:hypothetical protein